MICESKFEEQTVHNVLRYRIAVNLYGQPRHGYVCTITIGLSTMADREKRASALTMYAQRPLMNGHVRVYAT